MTDHTFVTNPIFTYTCIAMAAAAFLTGCAREEKTLLLPEAQSSVEETEVTDPAKDFSVKKIYAYSYETRDMLKQSAFLQGCGEKGIHIVVLDEQDTEPNLVYRHVDYRYGFYDNLGEFFPSHGTWSAPSNISMDDDLYVDAMLPSPDGAQILVSVRSLSDESCLVWLYTAGAQEPWLLYDGELAPKQTLKGAFSPDGLWVTYDLDGDTTGPDSFVPIYDCLKDTFLDREQYWTVRPDMGEARFLYPPDTFLYPAVESDSHLWTAGLWNLPDNDTPALLSILQGTTGDNYVQMGYRDSSLPGPGAAGKGSRLYYLGNDREENPEEAYQGGFRLIPALDHSEDIRNRYASIYLNMEKEMPYFLYTFYAPERLLYYMRDASALGCINMDTLQEQGQPRIFPEPVWDFLPLESGDFLVVLAQAYSVSPSEGQPFINSLRSSYWDDDSACPVFVQSTWDIQSGDLYLYPADGSPRQLLYKNVRNLLNMEYDSLTRRILLETFEEGYPSRRTCIILEL